MHWVGTLEVKNAHTLLLTNPGFLLEEKNKNIFSTEFKRRVSGHTSHFPAGAAVEWGILFFVAAIPAAQRPCGRVKI